MELKLYVWTRFCPDYTDGMAFAIAETEEQARSYVMSYMDFVPSEWGDLETKPISKCGYGVYGGG